MNFFRRRIAAFFVFISFLIVLAAATANADGVMWSSGTPALEQSSSAGTASDWQDRCQSKFHSFKQQIRLVTTNPDTKTDCYVGNVSGANVYSYSSSRALGVQFAGDSGAYRTGAGCDISCAFAADSNTFVTVESNNTAGTGRLAIYDNFLSRLTRVDFPNQNDVYYSFDGSDSKLISNFFGQPGYFGYIKHIGISGNGRWLVVEVVGKGLFRVDLETMQMLKFSTWSGSYGTGANATIEFDVTDDGQHVAVFGLNAPQYIYDITPDCGLVMPANPTQTDFSTNIAGDKLCTYLSLKDPAVNGLFLTGFKTAYQPQFNYDGGRISFIATDGSTYGTRVTLQAAGYVPAAQLDYLALGDSYSSGEGDTEKDENGNKYYRPYTNSNVHDLTIPRERCHVSTRSYPYKLAQGMGLTLDSPKQWDTVACSGAKVWDAIGAGSKSYLGQWDRLKGFDVFGLKDQALNEFIPGRVKQIEFVRRYQPKVITLTMGGNDVGFAQKIEACVHWIDTCNIVNERKSDLASEIYKQYDKLKELYEELYIASGSTAKVYVLGYPQFINGEIDADCAVNIGLLNSGERELIAQSVAFLNLVIRQAARASGVMYIDVEDSLVGHRHCDDGDKYINGIIDAGDWSQNRQESFHPNSLGHRQMALSVWDNVWNEELGAGESLLDYDICPDTNENICPDSGAIQENIEIPQYFASVDNQKNVENKRTTAPEQKKGESMVLVLDSYNLAPNSSVDVTLHSDPVNLGQYIVSDDGSLSANITIPADVPAGFHTIILSGHTYSGELVEYEQTLLINGADDNDADEDGIADSEDGCLFVPASGEDYDQDGIDDACDPTIGEPPAPSPSPTPTPSPTHSPSPEPRLNPISHIIKNIFHAIAQIINFVLSFLHQLFSLRFK